MEQHEYIAAYEKELMQHLLKMLTSMQRLEGQLLESADITNKWLDLAPAYIADAVHEIAAYPQVSLGWAMYLGMAVARYWDDDWKVYGKVPNLYEHLRNKRGFDYLDEVIRGEVLMLKEPEYSQAEKLVQSCAQQTLSKIRHEAIEPQSPLAYHIYVSSVRVLYQIGASVELHHLGYKFEKMQ